MKDWIVSDLWSRIKAQVTRDPSAREVGRTRTSGRQSPREDRMLPWRGWELPVLLGLGLLILHLFLFKPVPNMDLDFPDAGQIATHEIRAPFTFSADLLQQDINIRQMAAMVEATPVFENLGVAPGQAGSRMGLLLEALNTSMADTVTSLEERATMLSLQFPVLGRDDSRRLLMSADSDSLVPRMREAWSQILADGVVDELPPGKYVRVEVFDDVRQWDEDRDTIVSQEDVQRRLAQNLRAAGMPAIQSVTVASLMRHYITPNLILSPEQTRLRQELKRDEVPTKREFFKGERIVDRGVRVTQQQEKFLLELASKLKEKGAGQATAGLTLRYISRSLLVALALGLFGWFGIIHFPRSFKRLRTLLALTVIMALFLVGAAVALNTPSLGPFAVPVILLSLVTTVLFRGKVGYNVTLLAVTLLAVLPEFLAGHVLAWYLLGMVTVVSVRRIHKRGQFYQTILLLEILSIVMIFLLNAGGVGGPESSYLVGIFAPILLVAFGLFLLPVVEPLVGVCSDLTLLELSDLNHPLLQRMALEAQGTYHHSQVVGQLAEHAARTVDANSLLTRVGALFHDIGKMEKPEYYVENQHPGHNKHDELSPSMSALIIAAHVKDGVEMARKWHLPQAVIDFISEHHGTMVIEFFYHKALAGESNAPVKVDDFRYPGPKPRSRETAILMLADAVEAATRSLGKPTPSRIREVTKQIFDKRMLSGELDESGVTLSDLAKIRESFIPLLTGIHHSRIVYPGQKDKDPVKRHEKKGERKAGS